MDPEAEPLPPSDQYWRDYLIRGDTMERRLRNVLRLLPSGPRCHLCAAPFGGAGGGVMRLVGKRPSSQNPRVCNTCFDFIAKHHGGAEIEVSLLFADIRGSTTIAEELSPTAYRKLLDRFYAVATGVVFDHEGSVDKFVGDELVAMFYPMVSGDAFAERAIAAARALLVATGHAEPDGPWVPVGAGVDSGPSWVGAVGDAAHTELTALGDVVNTTARLASIAAAGEVLVTRRAATAAGLDTTGLVVDTVVLKGKRNPVEIVRLVVGGPVGAERRAGG